MTALLERAVAKASSLPDADQDALARLLMDEIEGDRLGVAEESVRRGWAEAQRGELSPASELWNGLEDG